MYKQYMWFYVYCVMVALRL